MPATMSLIVKVYTHFHGVCVFRPMTAYSLFFRDTQASIKAQNQQATFGEVSRIVASMWESLEPHEKQVYTLQVFIYQEIYR